MLPVREVAGFRGAIRGPRYPALMVSTIGQRQRHSPSIGIRVAGIGMLQLSRSKAWKFAGDDSQPCRSHVIDREEHNTGISKGFMEAGVDGSSLS